MNSPSTTSLPQVVSFVLAGLLVSCEREQPPSKAEAPHASSLRPSVSSTSLPSATPSTLPPAPPQVSAAASASPPHPGPFFTVTVPGVAIYDSRTGDRSAKLGYAQSGGRIPVLGVPEKGPGCEAGWLSVLGGGEICALSGTLDDNDKKLRFVIRKPDLDAVLPYQYMRNAHNGTPLYRSIPTREQMLAYEPYLEKKAAPKPTASSSTAPLAEPSPRPSNVLPEPLVSASPSTTSSSRVSPPQSSADPPPSSAHAVASATFPDEDTRPWWQREDVDDTLHQVKLDDLRADSDGVLAMRMVKGFYIAVDKTFRWNQRLWYKTTKGLIAPADRMSAAAASEFRGVELDVEHRLPVGWVYGGREKSTLYTIDRDKGQVVAEGSVPAFQALPLTDETVEVKKIVYRQLVDGKWIRAAHVRVAEATTPPNEVVANEPWVDVNLATQTLVLYQGATPTFATLISSGKKSKQKDKDHSTPVGSWRVREKHITTTMDGDGSAAGDHPYSIEDVPYVLYFHRSYAIHGAFWHRNFGVQMSHGCINLAPLDAKRVFFATAPTQPEGWHGALSTEKRPGSLIVVRQ